MSGRKEPLAPRVAGRVGIYWCGVTTYSRSHIGHARAMIASDVLYRYLRARGVAVDFVRNITDIEDKIIKRASEEGIEPAALVEREIAAFAEDTAWLRCLPPTHEPRATAHIDDMIAMIERLEAKGYAYRVCDTSVSRTWRRERRSIRTRRMCTTSRSGRVRSRASRAGRAPGDPDGRAGTSSAPRWRSATWERGS